MLTIHLNYHRAPDNILLNLSSQRNWEVRGHLSMLNFLFYLNIHNYKWMKMQTWFEMYNVHLRMLKFTIEDEKMGQNGRLINVNYFLSVLRNWTNIFKFSAKFCQPKIILSMHWMTFEFHLLRFSTSPRNLNSIPFIVSTYLPRIEKFYLNLLEFYLNLSVQNWNRSGKGRLPGTFIPRFWIAR